MPRTEYVRISIPLPLAEALSAKMSEISPHLGIKEIVVQACMEYLEKRSGIQNDKPQDGAKTVTSKLKASEPPPSKDIFSFDNFLED